MKWQLGWTTLPGLGGLSVSEFRATPTHSPDNERGVAVEFANDEQRREFLARLGPQDRVLLIGDSRRSLPSGGLVTPRRHSIRSELGRSRGWLATGKDEGPATRKSLDRAQACRAACDRDRDIFVRRERSDTERSTIAGSVGPGRRPSEVDLFTRLYRVSVEACWPNRVEMMCDAEGARSAPVTSAEAWTGSKDRES